MLVSVRGVFQVPSQHTTSFLAMRSSRNGPMTPGYAITLPARCRRPPDHARDGVSSRTDLLESEVLHQGVEGHRQGRAQGGARERGREEARRWAGAPVVAA